jgi:hypothetical protein
LRTAGDHSISYPPTKPKDFLMAQAAVPAYDTPALKVAG